MNISLKDLYQVVHKAYGGLLPVPMLTTTFKGECEFPAIAQTVLENGELCLYNYRYDCFLFADNKGTVGVAPAGPYSQGCDCEVIIFNDCPGPYTALDILKGWIEYESYDIKVLVTDFLGKKIHLLENGGLKAHCLLTLSSLQLLHHM